jgi:UDP-N-acetylmuramoylalanine--D-glutamate ligase
MKIAIFGMARSGLSAMKLAIKKGHEVTLINAGEPKSWPNYQECLKYPVKMFSEEMFLKEAPIQSNLILSPGIPRSHQICQKFLDAGFKVISEIEWAYSFGCPQLIAVTGSNGKTTTTSMIDEALKLAGFKVFVGGNIGIPFSEIHLTEKKYDYAVIEVSSFQLESIEHFHPHIAVLTNIHPNHMERYRDFQDYKNAKLNLLKNMASFDFVFTHSTFDRIETEAEVSLMNIEGMSQFDFTQSKLVGGHNKENFASCFYVLNALKIPNKNQVMQKLIDEFKGVEHRIEFVTEFMQMKFYNDSKSTNSLALKTALSAFASDIPVTLIIGGKLRENKVELKNDLKPFKNIKRIYCIGEARELLRQDLQADFELTVMETLDQAVTVIFQNPLAGVVLYSPGFPSFDQFKNFEERGLTFKKLVKSKAH